MSVNQLKIKQLLAQSSMLLNQLKQDMGTGTRGQVMGDPEPTPPAVNCITSNEGAGAIIACIVKQLCYAVILNANKTLDNLESCAEQFVNFIDIWVALGNDAISGSSTIAKMEYVQSQLKSWFQLADPCLDAIVQVGCELISIIGGVMSADPQTFGDLFKSLAKEIAVTAGVDYVLLPNLSNLGNYALTPFTHATNDLGITSVDPNYILPGTTGTLSSKSLNAKFLTSTTGAIVKKRGKGRSKHVRMRKGVLTGQVMPTQWYNPCDWAAWLSDVCDAISDIPSYFDLAESWVESEVSSLSQQLQDDLAAISNGLSSAANGFVMGCIFAYQKTTGGINSAIAAVSQISSAALTAISNFGDTIGQQVMNFIFVYANPANAGLVFASLSSSLASWVVNLSNNLATQVTNALSTLTTGATDLIQAGAQALQSLTSSTLNIITNLSSAVQGIITNALAMGQYAGNLIAQSAVNALIAANNYSSALFNQFVTGVLSASNSALQYIVTLETYLQGIACAAWGWMTTEMNALQNLATTIGNNMMNNFLSALNYLDQNIWQPIADHVEEFAHSFPGLVNNLLNTFINLGNDASNLWNNLIDNIVEDAKQIASYIVSSISNAPFINDLIALGAEGLQCLMDAAPGILMQLIKFPKDIALATATVGADSIPIICDIIGVVCALLAKQSCRQFIENVFDDVLSLIISIAKYICDYHDVLPSGVAQGAYIDTLTSEQQSSLVNASTFYFVNPNSVSSYNFASSSSINDSVTGNAVPITGTFSSSDGKIVTVTIDPVSINVSASSAVTSSAIAVPAAWTSSIVQGPSSYINGTIDGASVQLAVAITGNAGNVTQQVSIGAANPMSGLLTTPTVTFTYAVPSNIVNLSSMLINGQGGYPTASPLATATVNTNNTVTVNVNTFTTQLVTPSPYSVVGNMSSGLLELQEYAPANSASDSFANPPTNSILVQAFNSTTGQPVYFDTGIGCSGGLPFLVFSVAQGTLWSNPVGSIVFPSFAVTYTRNVNTLNEEVAAGSVSFNFYLQDAVSGLYVSSSSVSGSFGGMISWNGLQVSSGTTNALVFQYKNNQFGTQSQTPGPTLLTGGNMVFGCANCGNTSVAVMQTSEEYRTSATLNADGTISFYFDGSGLYMATDGNNNLILSGTAATFNVIQAPSL